MRHRYHNVAFAFSPLSTGPSPLHLDRRDGERDQGSVHHSHRRTIHTWRDAARKAGQALSRIGACLLLGIATANAAVKQQTGLVLSGGGARGLAHIGVIRALEEANVRIDYIAGTSMGAIIGALYASGKTPDEIERITLLLDWTSAFEDQAPRERLSFRRKQDSRDYLVKAQATLKSGVVSLPKGVVQGQNLQGVLQDLFVHAADITDFDRLPIPFRAVAADLASGEGVVLDRGDLATAVRASMSIPALFAPVEIGGRPLVDGGIANNLPVNVVREMGATRVIVVDIATPLYTASELDSVVPIIEQLTTFLTQNNAQAQLATLTDEDVLIQPKLNEVLSADFEKTLLAIDIGYRATKAKGAELETFSSILPVSRERREASGEDQFITAISLANNSFIADEVIMAHINQRTNAPLDKEQLEADVQSIHGLGYFESVSYQLDGSQGDQTLHLTVREKTWGHDLIGVSFELSTDSHSDNGYNFGVNFRKHGITNKGGDWFNVLQVGENPQARSELHLPLDHNHWFFFRPYLRYTETPFNDVQMGDIGSRFSIENLNAGLFLGSQLSNVAILGLGVEEHRGRTDTFIGADAGDIHYRDTNSYALLEWDTLDNLFFPNRGFLGSLRYDRVRPRKAGREDFDLLSATFVKAFEIRRHSLLLSVDYVRSADPITEPFFKQSLGGYQRLSGFPDNAFFGDNLLYNRLTYLHRLDEQSLLPVDLPVYLVVSVEAGNVWDDHRDISTGDLIHSGSIALAVDSPLGPLHFGYGRAEDGESAFYLRLGRPFIR